eukprot:2815507-Rhodomonas_salina.1
MQRRKKRKSASKSDGEDDDNNCDDDDDDDDAKGESRASHKKILPLNVVFSYNDNPHLYGLKLQRAISVKFDAGYARWLKADNKEVITAMDGSEFDFLMAESKFSAHYISILEASGEAELKDGVTDAPAKRLVQVTAFLRQLPEVQRHLRDTGEMLQTGHALYRAHIKDLVCTALGLSMDTAVHTAMQKTINATAAVKRQFKALDDSSQHGGLKRPGPFPPGVPKLGLGYTQPFMLPPGQQLPPMPPAPGHAQHPQPGMPPPFMPPPPAYTQRQQLRLPPPPGVLGAP